MITTHRNVRRALTGLAPQLVKLLTADGSIVLEV